MTAAQVVADSRAVLSQKARSFRWAAFFLPRAVHDDAAVLYAFCRQADDAVDEASDVQAARHALANIVRALSTEDPRFPVVTALRDLAERRGLSLTAAAQLLDGMRLDLGTVRVASDAELLRYCYLAAGTVGLMMCSVIGAHDPRAAPHAIDLGIAMQLTNICRDVREDAAIGRVYVPAERLAAFGVSHQHILDGAVDDVAVGQVVAELLALADRYYASADAGMHYIPPRPRLAIMVASRLYRAIGVRLLRHHGGNPMFGRAVVPPLTKAATVVTALARWSFWVLRPPRAPHDPTLHEHLRDLTNR